MRSDSIMVRVSWLGNHTNTTTLNFWNTPCSRNRMKKNLSFMWLKTVETTFGQKLVRLPISEIWGYSDILCVSWVCLCVCTLTLSAQNRVEECWSDNTLSLYHTVRLKNHRYASHFLSPFPIRSLFSPQTSSKDSWMIDLYCCLQEMYGNEQKQVKKLC